MRRIAILYPGDRAAQQVATSDNNRFAAIFRALAELGLLAESAVYSDTMVSEVKQQLTNVNAVLVWVNPLEGCGNRTVLDTMLREIASCGKVVSAHPDVILKMGTKQVLYDTRSIGWGCDTHVYRSIDELRSQLPLRLMRGEVRVLKQYRGNGGDGVWKVNRVAAGEIGIETPIKVRHAKRGSIEMEIPFREFLTICERYFSGSGRMIDQEYQQRLPDGMIRVYFVGNEVVGFGHQQINALFPAPLGAPASEAPQPGPRLYHPPTNPDYQTLKRLAQERWVPAMQQVLGITSDELPIIWDADFLLGKPDEAGQDTYVLCEINVSCVSPFPDSAINKIASATRDRIERLGP
jgi:hypothetical protein